MKISKEIRPLEVLLTARWLTMAEAASYARGSIKTIRRWLADGLIYGQKAGEWRIDRESIDKYFLRARADVDKLQEKMKRRTA